MCMQNCTWIELCSKTKIDEAYCIPRVGRLGLEHDVAGSDVQVAYVAVQVHVIQSLHRIVKDWADSPVCDRAATQIPCSLSTQNVS